MRKLFAVLVAALFLASCSGPKTEEQKMPVPRAGNWQMIFEIAEVEIPVRMYIRDSAWVISNASEKIVIDSIHWEKDGKFHVKMPLFNSTLDGRILNDSTMDGLWTDHSRDTLYTIPFHLHAVQQGAVSGCQARTGKGAILYDATFSPSNPAEISKAVGVFEYGADGALCGTFLTEMGDYRFLEGYSTGQSLHLSCFDGAHLFYFCANVKGDSLTDGKFYSGRHWEEEWIAHKDLNARLRDPDSLTTQKNSADLFNFKVLSVNGDSIDFDFTSFKDKVTIVQIFGSWCPNCSDESVFIRELYEKYEHQGLQVIPVAFERTNDFEESRRNVTRQFKELGLNYPPYFGGVKSNASTVFSDLSRITSYPTTVFIDKSGRVRKIHTGFYGPGTGDYYTHHTQLLDMFVSQLISEQTVLAKQ